MNSISPYFNVLYLLDEKLSNDIGFSISSAIMGWDNYIKSVAKINLFGDHYQLTLDLTSKPKLEINRQCKFIKKSDNIIQGFKEHLKCQYQKQIEALLIVTIRIFIYT